MNILFAHNDYSQYSGEERAIDNFVGILKQNGHKISMLRKSSTGNVETFSEKGHAFFSGIYSFSSKEDIEILLQKKSIDIVHIQNLYPFLSPSILIPCRERNIPVVMRCPNYRIFCPNGLHYTKGQICERCLGGKEWNCVMYNCLESVPKSIGYAIRNAFARISRIVLNNVSKFIVLSNFQRDRFIEAGIEPERIQVIPNIAPKIYEQNDNINDGKFIAYVGRISPEKGINTFIKAAENYSDAQFRIAGSSNGISKFAVTIPANLHFDGFLKGDLLFDFFAQSRFVIIPSVCFEAFPNTALQAMAHGKAVVASRIGGLPEIIDDNETGLLFEPGNTDDLTEKIEYLWKNPNIAVKMGEAGRRKAENEYSEESVYRKLIEIYEKATITK